MKRKDRKKPSVAPKVRKASAQEIIAHTIQQNYSYQHSIVIRKKRELVQLEADQMEETITALSKALADAKIRRTQLWAQIVGLTRALECRDVGELNGRS